MTQVQPGIDPSPGERPPTWRETIETDPLGIATHRPSAPEPAAAGGPDRPRHELLRLGAVVAANIAVGFLGGYGETVLRGLALMACIVAHEFGHYAMAKTGGVKVTEFFVGFGPRLWSVKRGETEYGVKSLPLGGYCRIIGMNNLEEVEPADEGTPAPTYRHASLGRRLAIDVAGSAMHFLIALVVLFAMFFWTGDQGRYLTVLPASNPIVEIDGLSTGASPAQTAGFKVGDRIMAIDGRRFDSWQAMGTYIQDHPGTKLDVTVSRTGRLVHLFPVPVNLNAVRGRRDQLPPPPTRRLGDRRRLDSSVSGSAR